MTTDVKPEDRELRELIGKASIGEIVSGALRNKPAAGADRKSCKTHFGLSRLTKFLWSCYVFRLKSAGGDYCAGRRGSTAKQKSWNPYSRTATRHSWALVKPCSQSG